MSSKSSSDSGSVVRDDGLRYKNKTLGSPFTVNNGFSGTMSCFRCGQHKAIAEMVTKKILGKSQRVCRESCRS